MLYRPFNAGGINLYSIIQQNTSLKLKALNKLANAQGQYWSDYLESCLIVKLHLLPKINFAKRHIHLLLKPGKTLPGFWVQVLQEWSLLNFKNKHVCLKDALLLGNSALPTRLVFNGPLMAQYHDAGVYTIADVLKCQVGALPRQPFILAAIYKLWPDLQFPPSPATLDLITPLSVRAINLWLQKMNCTQPSHVGKAWALDSCSLLVGQSWNQICNIRKQFVSVKLQSFYWRYIKHAFFTNSLMLRACLSNSDLCTFCKGAEETFAHLFWECSMVQELLQDLIHWCTKYVNDKVVYDRASCLILGFQSSVLNNVFLIAKYYIYTQRYFKIDHLHFHDLLQRIARTKYTHCFA